MFPFEVFLNIPFPCWIFDVHSFKFLSVNAAAVRQYGYSEEEFLDQLTIKCIRPSVDVQLLDSTVVSLKGANDSGVWRHQKKNGEIFYVHIYSYPLQFRGYDARFVTALDVSDQVHTERKARKLHYMVSKQKEQLESILSSLNEVVWSIRPDTHRLKYISPVCEQVFGFTDQELIQDTGKFLSRIHPEDQLRLPNFFKSLNKESNLTAEFRYLHPDGNLKYIWLVCRVLMNSAGKPTKITGSSIDVTTQRTAELALKEQHKQMDEIFESISDIFFVLNNQLDFVYVNNVFEATYKVAKENLIGKNIWDHFKAAKAYKYFEQFNKALDEKTAVEFEEYAPSIDQWLFVKAYPFSGGLAVYFRNITQEKKLRERMKKNTQNTRALIDNTDDLIWSLDKELRLLSFNNAYSQWFFSARHQWPQIGQPELTEELGAASFHKWMQYYRRALGGSSFKAVETETHNGITKHVECSFKPIHDKDGSIWGVSCFSKDITDYRNKIDEIELQNKKLKEIAWLQSHKVRSPVATILGLIQLLNKEDFGDPGNMEIMDHVETAARTLDEVIHTIVLHTNELKQSAGST